MIQSANKWFNEPWERGVCNLLGGCNLLRDYNLLGGCNLLRGYKLLGGCNLLEAKEAWIQN